MDRGRACSRRGRGNPYIYTHTRSWWSPSHSHCYVKDLLVREPWALDASPRKRRHGSPQQREARGEAEDPPVRCDTPASLLELAGRAWGEQRKRLSPYPHPLLTPGHTQPMPP